MVTEAEAKERRRALRRVRDTLKDSRGWKVSDWCRNATKDDDERISLSNAVSNFLTGRSKTLSYDNYKKLADAAGVSIATLGGQEQNVPSLVSVIIRSEAGGTMWAEGLDWPESQHMAIAADIPTKYAKSAFGVRIVAPDMNEFYPVGAILICVPIDKFSRPPAAGDHLLCVQRREGKMRQMVREFQLDPQGNAWLSPRSTDPRFKTPTRLTLPADDSERLEIAAVVIAAQTGRPNID